MPRLFLRLPEPLDEGEAERRAASVEWLIRDDDAVAAEGCTTLGELAGVAEQCEPWLHDPANVMLLVATSEALALSCDVPGRSAAQLRHAAPYAVEEFVTDDIDTMQVACGALARGAPVRCLVAPRDLVARYVAGLESAGISPGWMTTDAMALPTAPGLVTILYGDDIAFVRTADQTAGVDLDNLPAVLEAVRDSVGAAHETRLLQVNGTLSELHLRQAEISPEQVEDVALDGSLLAYMAASFDAAGAINLLQGDFAPSRAASGAWAHWRAVAAGVGVWLALALALLAAEGLWASHRADALREEAKQIYQDIYDVDRVPGNPVSRMRFRLGQAPAAKAGFHHLLANLGASFQELSGRFELTSLSYSDRSGLGAEVIVPDYDALETLQDALAARGVDLEVVSAEQEQERVRTNLRMIEEG